MLYKISTQKATGTKLEMVEHLGPWIFPPFNFLKIGTMEFAVPVPISQCTRIGKTFDLSLHGSQSTFSTFAMYSVPAERRFQGSCAGA